MRIKNLKEIANDYLRAGNIECSHIEYKASGNQLDKILKTICAFGNNYYDNDFSFIYIGVEEENSIIAKGTPKLPIKGIEKSKLEMVSNELLSLKPYIYPNVKYDVLINEFDNISYLFIVVERQGGGPFQVTDKAIRDKKISLKPGRYIRVDGVSRLATISEEYELLRKFSAYHFSSDVNPVATIDDLDIDYLREYMKLASNRDLSASISKMEIVKALNLLPNNELSTRVKNCAILMFSNQPEKIIPYSSIDIITDTLGTSKRMEAKSFSGPIWKQYFSSLKYIEDNFLRTITVRKDNIATNEKVSNFPFKAVEELLANAIVHKNYESGKSIQVYISEKMINIINYNRPLPPVTIKDLNERYLFHERDSVNPEIRDMFKSLGIIESYGTGVGEAKSACEKNGSQKIYYKQFDSNDDITSVIIPCSDKYLELINKKLGIDDEKLGIGDEKLGIREKIKISAFSINVKNNLDKILLEYGDSIFGPSNIIELLGCSRNSATSYIRKMIELDIVDSVIGLGKSKYRFK